MDEYVIPIFIASFGGCMLTLGAWFVRGLTRNAVVTLWAVHPRATSPFAYWFWAIYHVVGMSLVIVVAIATTLYFVLDALA